MAIAARLDKLTIVSDSNYIIENVTKNMPTWEDNGWLSAKHKPLENEIEFRCISHFLSLIQVTWSHIPGHSGCVGNDIAHNLAFQGRLSGDPMDQTPIAFNDTPKQDVSTKVTPQVMSIRIKETNTSKIIPYQTIVAAQEKDEQIKQFIVNGSVSDKEPEYLPGINLYRNGENGVFAKGIIYVAPRVEVKVNAIYVPVELRTQVIKGIHLSKWVNHAGFLTTCSLLLEHYFWEIFRRDVRNYLHTCQECQKNSPPRRKVEVMDFVKPNRPGRKLAVDIIGPIVTSHEGYKYILTMIDMFTRYVVLCPMKSLKAEELISCMETDYITIFGVPECVVTDRGSNFRSTMFTQACNILRIKHFISSPYHPATNGMVERMNKEVKRKLISLCDNAGKSWAGKIHLVQFAHNNAHHSCLNTTPNLLTFSENRRFPEWHFYEAHPLELGPPDHYIDNLRSRLDDIREIAWEYEEDARKKRNMLVNIKRVLPKYSVGDLVLYRSVRLGKTRKHGFKYVYDGPFEIKKCISKVGYDIGLEGDLEGNMLVKRVHVERLRPFFKATVVQDEPIPHTVSMEIATPTDGEIPIKGITVSETKIPSGENKDKPDPNGRKPNTAVVDATNSSQLSIDLPSTDPSSAVNHSHHTRSKNSRTRRCYRHWSYNNCKCLGQSKEGLKERKK